MVNGGRRSWEWECAESGSTGVSPYGNLKRHMCKACRTEFRGRRRDEIQFRTKYREVLGAEGFSGGDRTYRWRCKRCGNEGVSSRFNIENSKHCVNCDPEYRMSRDGLTPGDVYGEKRVVCRVRSAWKSVCLKKGHESFLFLASIRNGGQRECSKCAEDIVGDIVNGREVLSLEESTPCKRWRCLCLSCGKISTLGKSTLVRSSCSCLRWRRFDVGGLDLSTRELAKLSGVGVSSVRKKIRDGWSPLEVILGERKGA